VSPAGLLDRSASCSASDRISGSVATLAEVSLAA
jgi:hypothetical protein